MLKPVQGDGGRAQQQAVCCPGSEGSILQQPEASAGQPTLDRVQQQAIVPCR